MNEKDRKNRYSIRCLCAILVSLCILNLLGISLNFHKTVQSYIVERKILHLKASDRERPKIALTFDDGPNAACTGKLLDGLKQRDVKATFFVLGKNVENSPELTKRIYEEGHLIGNHTYNHILLSKVSEEKAEEELEDTNDAIYKATGEYPAFMRPPYGVCSKKLEASVDMILVRWTIDPLDWNTKSTDKIVNKVVTQAEENDIILLHDCYNSSVDAAFEIIDKLKKKGFEFVTVDELCLD